LQERECVLSELTKVLHVEDEADIREIAQMALELIGGLDVCLVGSGAAALEALDSFQPQLVLTDVQMPGMTGPETLAAIRARPGYAEMPGIYMTAKIMESEREALLGPRDIGVIAKPFDPMTLASDIRALWQAAGL